jgi:predicted small lipoprotein YifL
MIQNGHILRFLTYLHRVRLQVTYYMLTIRRASQPEYAHVANAASFSRKAVSTFIISSAVMLGLSGCGQKGALYLANADSQTVQSSSAVLDSTSNPQDAAFSGLNDDTAQQTSNIELPEPSTDPNDY